MWVKAGETERCEEGEEDGGARGGRIGKCSESSPINQSGRTLDDAAPQGESRVVAALAYPKSENGFIMVM